MLSLCARMGQGKMVMKGQSSFPKSSKTGVAPSHCLMS